MLVDGNLGIDLDLTKWVVGHSVRPLLDSSNLSPTLQSMFQTHVEDCIQHSVVCCNLLGTPSDSIGFSAEYSAECGLVVVVKVQ